MGWQFLSVDDRRQLTDELAELGLIQLGPTSRSALLNQAGLADLISQLDSLGNSSAQVFAAELVGALENETTLPEQPHHQALGLLLDYVLSQSDTPQSTRAVCARLIVRYRLIDDEAVLSQLTTEYEVPPVVTPWNESRREIFSRRPPIERLNRLMVASVLGALALLVVVIAVIQSRFGETATPAAEMPTVGPVISEYQVALTVDEECPDEWQDLDARIKENVDASTPTRPVVYSEPEDAYLVLALTCNNETVAWTADWTNPAPIFNIVGSPQEVEIMIPLNLADSELLGRALIHYGQNNYNSARNALAQLVNRSEALDLQLLYANTLLLTEEFPATIDSFTQIISSAEGDLLALVYNNRGLAHLDEYHRLEERDIISQEEHRLGLSDLAHAQSLLMAESAPEVRALVNSNVGIFELLLMFPDKDMNAITDRADAACRAAEAADPGSTWMRVCRAAVIIDKRKFESEVPCEPQLYADAERWLTEAQEPPPELAATYYWRALLLVLNVKGCLIAPTGEMSFMEQCVEWKQQLVALRESGWAPLYLHVYLEEVFPRCSVLLPDT